MTKAEFFSAQAGEKKQKTVKSQKKYLCTSEEPTGLPARIEAVKDEHL